MDINPSPAARLHQLAVLSDSVRELNNAARYAHQLRTTQNTSGDWQPVSQYVEQAYSSARTLFEQAVDLSMFGGRMFQDVDARSAINDVQTPLRRADDAQLTAIGRSRLYGETAQELVEARDSVRRQFDKLWARSGTTDLDQYHQLIGGLDHPLPQDASAAF